MSGLTSLRYCLIDLSGIYRTHWHATEHKPQNEAMSRTLEDIERNTQGYDPNNVAICCDTRVPTFRSKLCESYKESRAEAPAGLYALMRATEDELAKSHHIFRADGFEADDVCASLAAFLQDAVRGCEIELVSTDKDLNQCVTDSCVRIVPKSGKRYDVAAVVKEFGVLPHLFPHWQVFVGDKADDILGVKGVGPKAATKLIDRFGSIGAIRADLATGGHTVAAVVKDKLRDAIKAREAEGGLELDLKLATMRQDALSLEECRRILDTVSAPTAPTAEPPAETEPPSSTTDPNEWVNNLLNL